MKTADFLPNVSTARGAPMGRHSYGIAENCERRSIRLFRVPLDSGGYDRGGAYWGLGEPLYMATDGDSFRATVRASSRFGALAKLEIEPELLVMVPKLAGCYSIHRELCGQPGPRYVLRYWGQFTSHHATKGEAYTAALENYRSK